MAYTAVPTITTGDVATAAWGNTYIKDNFAAGVPDIFTTDGDMAVGTGANAAERVAVMNASNLITHEVGGLESNVSSGDGLVQVKAGSTTVIKSNIAASSNPGTGDDTGDGYAIGSFWLNTSADRPWVCLDASSGAAVWKEMSGISNIVEDTSPELGGNLDANSRAITELGHISFLQPQVPSAGANDLDDYEEGSWTIGFTDESIGDGTEHSQEYGNRVATYTKIGRKVDIFFNVQITGLGTLALGERALMVVMPFPSNASIATGSLTVAYAGSLALPNATESVTGIMNEGTTKITLYLWDVTTGSSLFLCSELSDGGNLVGSGSYYV